MWDLDLKQKNSSLSLEIVYRMSRLMWFMLCLNLVGIW